MDKLNLPSYTGFVQPKLTAVTAPDGKITDVTISYPMDLATQMLELLGREASVKTFWLSTHLDYACRHSGACCTARWPIPIEPDRAAAVSRAIASGRLNAPLEWFRIAPGSPGDVSGVLAQQPSGACVFHRGGSYADAGAPVAGGCAIHEWRPRSCEHFSVCLCHQSARGARHAVALLPNRGSATLPRQTKREWSRARRCSVTDRSRKGWTRVSRCRLQTEAAHVCCRGRT